MIRSLTIIVILANSLTVFANAPISPVTCAGVATDGTSLKVDASIDKPLKVIINNKLDSAQYMVQSYAVIDELEVEAFLSSVNDGQERHVEIEYSEGYMKAWNTMKLYSVETGKRYLSTQFTCVVQN